MSGTFQKGSPRMFDSAVLEKLSRVHPSIPAILYMPIAAVCVWAAVAVDHTDALGIVWRFAAGYAAWTLTEYWLHRLLFHLPVRGPRTRTAYFFIHGVHHDWPWDPSRLVMPPAVSLLLGSLVYLGVRAALGPDVHAAFGGFLFGYAVYDTFHWYTHVGAPKNRLLKYLRREHMVHHFRESGTRFGVTCPYWDVVFRTAGRP
ncbi:MAG TPA: sterol desaturase family protein [Kofleriaceae bacterium]|jgi:sterol desaturase/sphingolipid hydroxylase (fatty acid hydroxylase superfamily)|nr:sterol desaturase family protein [Kofleriaceae bacterium]